MTFSPDDTGIANGNYFGFPFSIEESDLVLISAPWEVTVSYNQGTAAGPQAMIEASIQIEIYDPHAPAAWRRGIATLPADDWIATASDKYREIALSVIEHIEQGGDISEMTQELAAVNEASEKLNEIIYHQSTEILDRGKIAALVGGDHSTPLGLIRALATKHESFGILHIDAHCDLREAYEGFEYSHASIMHNAIKLPQVSKLVQVAVRDYSERELLDAQSDPRIVQFTDYNLHQASFMGTNWDTQCREIVGHLPQKVYLSFDIDGLSREHCPSTGTPVPGGLSFNQAIHLLLQIRGSGRTIIGFDLTEVSPNPDDEWDANLGARILYKLCTQTLL